MAQMIAGFDAGGHPVPMTPTCLEQLAASWPTSSGTPTEIAELLRISRRLFAHSFFVYEFMAVAALWSFLALEAALRACLQSHAPFAKLIDQACEQGRVGPGVGELLHAARELRNGFAHPSTQAAWTVGMAAPTVEASHRVIADLFPEKEGTTEHDGA